MDGCVWGWMDGWIGRCAGGWIDVWVDDGCVGGWMNNCVVGWMGVWMVAAALEVVAGMWK